MAQMIGASMTLETLEKIVSAMKAKAKAGDENGGKYFNMTIAVNNDAPRYGQNVSMFAAQSKEDRDANKTKFYVGNGKTFWSGDGEFIPAKYDPNATSAPTETAATTTDDLPF